jgi:hypothetical protein
MTMHYTTRVCVREFLNLPGFNAGAYVLAEVQDTSRREPEEDNNGWRNYSPSLTLEISDCSRRIGLEFDVCSERELENSLHKVDTLIDALWRFRQGLKEEAALYAKRRDLIRQLTADAEAEPAGRRDASRVA